MKFIKDYDVIVIGGGHSGIEGAYASSNLGLKTMLLTISLDSIGLMPCNPSIGGPAKSHLVFEIDALGGLMAKIADKTSIQKKTLNRSKGPAVYALRAQIDRFLYSREMVKVLEKQPGLDIFQGEVKNILIENGSIIGVELTTGLNFKAQSIIVATGTYLSSKVIIGDFIKDSGPNELSNSKYLGASLNQLGIKTNFFKTGTPPRLKKSSLDLPLLEIQPGDSENYTFSFEEQTGSLPQVDCYLAYTTDRTKKIIEDNLHRSPLYSGVIQGIGPRYCPSIEDKIVRFPAKEIHHLFIEPEGHDVEEIYLQGFSTSLPGEVQLEMVHSIRGLENSQLMKLGYAIEYEVINSTELKATLESKTIPNLYFAGQVNGTSGYEEAAAQGLIAGINAALKLKGQEPLVLDRSEAYIGVLIDDLVTKGTNEPYRMFTARAEYRLLLRQSNADRRLTEKAYAIGMIPGERYQRYLNKIENIDQEIKRLGELTIEVDHPKVQAWLKEVSSSPLEQSLKASHLLKRPEISYSRLLDIYPSENILSPREKEEVELLVKYEGYISKQIQQVELFKKGEKKMIPEDLTDYKVIKGLTLEAAEKLNLFKPASVGQASRISGITPADIQVLLVYLEQRRRSGGDH
ncbi:MAG: tRNA uridine-5-carboxymethylaminomethyl(34) synthesis enzyme MnmG [Fusobacteria bacterium]|nr:tRNA uridine-5-carboxymethylaminomethyl(34) synthesis enzyme MnmG [Fusobacteriota bacterium]